MGAQGENHESPRSRFGVARSACRDCAVRRETCGRPQGIFVRWWWPHIERSLRHAQLQQVARQLDVETVALRRGLGQVSAPRPDCREAELHGSQGQEVVLQLGRAKEPDVLRLQEKAGAAGARRPFGEGQGCFQEGQPEAQEGRLQEGHAQAQEGRFQEGHAQDSRRTPSRRTPSRKTRSRKTRSRRTPSNPARWTWSRCPSTSRLPASWA